MTTEFSVITDTATLAIFDLGAIRHRMSDTFDWWSIQRDEIYEMNEGNIAFLNLVEDGKYVVKVLDDLPGALGSLFLSVPSGRVFIGAGEDTTGGDLEPDISDAIQGAFIDLAPGNYQMSYAAECGVIKLSFACADSHRNNFSDSIRLG
ncbi:DUF6386 family protein [Pseudomonas sp. BNK-30]|uniref:DUF6386 family protein n=1 Tax=Pseudomonas sp. BNK-30 TaxID=3376165 RepID=UPI0039BFD30C